MSYGSQAGLDRTGVRTSIPLRFKFLSPGVATAAGLAPGIQGLDGAG